MTKQSLVDIPAHLSPHVFLDIHDYMNINIIKSINIFADCFNPVEI
jgi:hypothetical protein